jgi:hypothetical protein
LLNLTLTFIHLKWMKKYTKKSEKLGETPQELRSWKKKIPKEIKTQVGIPESCKTIHSIR